MENKPYGVIQLKVFGNENDDFNRLQMFHESKIYPLILETLKRKGLIRFGDAKSDKGFYSYKNYLIGLRYGIALILPRKNFRLEKLKGLITIL